MEYEVYSFITEDSILAAILWCNVFIVAIYFFRRNTKFIKNFTITPLMLFAILCICRIVFIFEMPFTITIESTVIFPAIEVFLKEPIAFGETIAFTLMELLLAVWVVGAVYFAVRLIVSTSKLKKRFDTFEEVKCNRILDMLAEISAANNKANNGKIIMSESVSVPMVVGFFKPTIILPTIGLSDKELYNILSHEFMHFVQKDSWIKLFVQILSIIFWWNPFIHMFMKSLDSILEMRCDAKVIEKKDKEEKIQYLETIVKILEYSSSRKKNNSDFDMENTPCSAFLSLKKTPMIVQRFEVVLNDHKSDSKVSLGVIYSIIIIIFIISNTFIIQPDYPPPSYDGADRIYVITDETTKFVEKSNGTLDVYVEGDFFENITKEELKEEPYSELSINK